MQQPKNDFGQSKYVQQSSESSPPVSRQVPRKHYTKRDHNGRMEHQNSDNPSASSGEASRKYYTKKEQNGLSEESVTWQNVDEVRFYLVSYFY